MKIAAQHLNKRGGVLIGDMVGLGKTLMATALTKVFQDDHFTETLILCPKNLVKMWEDYVAEYRLLAKVLSVTRAVNELPNLRRYKVVLIDESHNLRNRAGKRNRAIAPFRNTSSKTKAAAFCSPLRLTIKHTTIFRTKVLIFTQFADTVRYLSVNLQTRGVSKLAGVTGGSEDPTNLAWRFSPTGNRHESNQTNPAFLPENELRVLIATDVLSEGQNLQDAAVIVNYDLPWAIIRLIQRAGRVDRIGQRSDKIFCYSFLPAEGIENVIHLRSRVRSRLRDNAEVVGTAEGNDALAWVDKDGKPVTQSQFDILCAAECAPETPALPRREDHHDLTRQGAQHIVS